MTELPALQLHGGPYDGELSRAATYTLGTAAVPFFCTRRASGEWHRYVLGEAERTYDWDGPCHSRHHEYEVCT